MTISKGETWGRAVPRPADLTTAGSDHELAGLVAAGGDEPLGVAGGDLFGTIGAPVADDPMQLLPVDLLRIDADGVTYHAVAHVVARRSWWRGRIVAVLNVDHIGSWNVAPRAHPNDGRFDVVDVAASMPARQRIQARRRLPLGTQVPHPGISTTTGTVATWRFDRRHRLYIDGRHVGSVTDLTVRIEADAFEIHV